MSPRTLPPARSARVRVSPRTRRVLLGIGVGVLGIVAGTALAGGFDRHVAVADGPRTAAPGEPVATGAFDLTVSSWGLDRTIDPDRLTDLGADAWLVVAVDVLNTDTSTRNLDRAAVTLPDPLPAGLELVRDELAGDDPSPRPETTVLVRDSGTNPAFQPGLAEETLLAWPVTGELEGEPDLTVSLPTYVYRDMTVGGGRRWAETGRAVTVDAPYDVVPAAQEPAELTDLDDPWGLDEGATS